MRIYGSERSRSIIQDWQEDLPESAQKGRDDHFLRGSNGLGRMILLVNMTCHPIAAHAQTRLAC
jgi:hypothetical protein